MVEFLTEHWRWIAFGVGVVLVLFGDQVAGLPGKLKSLIPSLPTRKPVGPEDDCIAALQCLLNHALKAKPAVGGPVLAKLLELVEPVHKMHETE